MLACAEYLINETTININPEDNIYMTPLKFACMEGHADFGACSLEERCRC